jgi:aspartate aminotransferase
MSRAAPAEIDALLAPQERFEALRERALLRNGRRLCDLAYANPYAGPPADVVRAIAAALERRNAGALDLQYTPYGGATIARRCVADRLSATHTRDPAHPFHWRDVVLTPGAMAALTVVLASLTPGTILVVAPCWLDTPLYVAAHGHRCVLVPVRADDHRLDIAAIAAALRAHSDVRAVVLSQPANPTGVVYTEDELRALADALAPTRPLLVSDECHRALAFAPFCSPARLYDDTVVVYSFGKALALQGQRIGYAAVSPRMRDGRAFARALERSCRTLGICTPTALMQRALPALLDVTPDVARVAERSALVYEALVKAGYRCVRPDGTFFLYARVPAFRADRHGDDFAFAEALAHDGVLVMPSSLFWQPGWFRISVTATDAMLAAAVPILQAHGAGGAR